VTECEPVGALAVVTAVYDEVFGDCDVTAADRLLAPGYRHSMNGRPFDRDAIVRHVGVLEDTYRSVSILPFDDAVVDGDRVAVRYTARAQRPDGTVDTLVMAAFCTVTDGRLAECHEVGYSTT
jgi:predicted SnoaL-like aldol condensation-catalyzing enzyme